MTTLPQTTTVRAAQPAAAGAGPMLYAHAGAAGGAGAFPMTASDIWRIIRANIWMIIIVVVLSVAAGYMAHVVWLKNWPSYTATGYLKVRRQIMTDAVSEKMRNMSDSELITALRTQAQRLKMEGLHSVAIKESADIRKTKWIKGFSQDMRKAKEDLQDHFKVYALPDTELLVVEMKCEDPADAQVIVNEIVGKHLAAEKLAAGTALDERTKALRLLQSDYDGQIKQVSDIITKRQMELAQSGMGVEGLFSAREAELRALVEGRMKLASEVAEADAQYKRFKEQVDGGMIPPEVQRYIDNDPMVAALSRELISYQIRHDAQTQIELLGKEHKDVVSSLKMAELTAQKLKDQQDKIRLNLQTQLLETLKGMASVKQAELKSVRDQIDKLRTEHEGFSSQMARLIMEKERQKELNTQRQQTANILANINASQNPDSQVQIEWAQPALPPEMPSWPKLWFMLPAAFAIGLVLALGIAFLREFLDDTVRSPRDIVRVGQMTLLGMIADEDDDPQVANAKLPIFDAPHSLTAEQFRQVRTRLQHATSLETTRSIMVTGPSPMDGKTTVAANLAAGLALNGRKILLVDANFRRPEIHHLFDFSNEKGFSDVLNGTSAFDECLHPTRIPNLSVMTSGPKPLNVTELFESQLLVDYIEKALEEFDHVIFDSGPLLVVSESVAMAPRVDGVITVVRAHAESRGLLQRMRDALKQIKAEHVGVVLNAVRAQGGGYYGRNIKAYYTYNNGQ